MASRVHRDGANGASDRQLRAFTAATDSIKSGVFISKRARARAPSETEASETEGRPMFEPIFRDESEKSRAARSRAYERAWGALDAHCQQVVDEANADAFEKVSRFVEETHDGYLERTAREVTTSYADERVPVGVVLAGGVNSDDHEETFAALTKSLRKTGRAHCALLRSRDLKARAGVGTGSIGVAFGVIMRQLDRSGAHWSGKNMRALARWHKETTAAKTERLGNGGDAFVAMSPGPLTVWNGVDGDPSTCAALAVSKKRGRNGDDSVAVSPATRRSKRRAREESQAREKSGDDSWDYPAIQGTNCPVVLVVEDTESFDARVLDSLLRSVSEFATSVPVIVLLGLATSVGSLQGMLPAATAALLNARAFQLWAPGKMMEAVQERVLLSAERVPAFGSEVLNVLHTRFKEHDFSLAAVRRALHLLTLTHFMTEPLSAVLPLLAQDASDACADGEDSDDEYGDAIDQFARTLEPNAVEYARRKHGFGESSNVDKDAPSTKYTRSELSAALKDVYRLRRRWALSLKCIQIACAASEQKLKKTSITTMADLLLDASRDGYFGKDAENDRSAGGSLMNVICSRVLDEFTTAEIGVLIQSMLKVLDKDEVMRSAQGSELRFLLMRIEDGSFEVEDARRAREAETRATTVREARDDGVADGAATGGEIDVDAQKRAIALILEQRKRKGGGGGSFKATSMTPTAAPRAEIDADADGLVLPKSPTRGRSAPALPAPETGDQSLALALRTPTPSKAASVGKSGASKEFCDILRSIARTYSSRPPESLAASGIFVVTDVDCVRAALQASPRLALENTLTDPSEILRCTCCRRDEYDLKASRRVPKSLPDASAAYRLLARFGEQAPIHDWFRSFCESRTGGANKPTASSAANPSGGARGKGTFGLPRETLWELQARFTRAVAELEFLGIARPYQKGRKGVEYMVRTAFPLDKLARDSHNERLVDRLAIRAPE